MADESSPKTASPEADGTVDAPNGGSDGIAAGVEDDGEDGVDDGGEDGESDPSGRYDVPPPDEIRRRNRITGFILLLVILTFITVAVWARL